MEREIDLAPRHLLDWLKADLARGGAAPLEVRATREFLAEDGPATAEGLDAEDGMEVADHRRAARGRAPRPAARTGCSGCASRTRSAATCPRTARCPTARRRSGSTTSPTCFLAAGDPDATVTLEAGCAADRPRLRARLARILADRHAAQT